MIGPSELLITLLAVTQPASQPEAQMPIGFEVNCSLIGRGEARARFALAAAGTADNRRFAIRPDPSSRWIGPLSAGTARDRNVFRFVSGGVGYLLVIEPAPNGSSLAATVKLEEDRGAPPLNLRLAEGSCRGLSTSADAELPSLPPAPEVRAETFQSRPISLHEGSVPSECTIVRRDLQEVRFLLDVTFDAHGILLAVSPSAGGAWPTAPFVLRGASLAALTMPSSGPSGGFMTVFAAAGATPGTDAAARIGYQLRAEGQQMDGWIEVAAANSDTDFSGAGYCGVRQSANQEAERGL